MLLSNAITAFLILSVASAAILKARSDPSTVIDDLAAIKLDISAIQDIALVYSGTTDQNSALYTDFDALNAQLQKSINDSIATGSLSGDDSSTVVREVFYNLTSPFVSVLDVLESQASLFISGGYSTNLTNELEATKTITDDLYTAILADLTPETTPHVKQDQRQVDAAFAETLSAY